MIFIYIYEDLYHKDLSARSLFDGISYYSVNLDAIAKFENEFLEKVSLECISDIVKEKAPAEAFFITFLAHC